MNAIASHAGGSVGRTGTGRSNGSAEAPALVLPCPLVLVGMPGAGKSSIGRRLAARLALPFVDSDDEIEAAARMKTSEIFARLGEPAFRQGERRVIERLLGGPVGIISTGGGAFIQDDTRALIKAKALSVWIQAGFDILLERTGRNRDRPLLVGDDPAALLRALLERRAPLYAKADLAVLSDATPVDDAVSRLIAALSSYLAAKPPR